MAGVEASGTGGVGHRRSGIVLDGGIAAAVVWVGVATQRWIRGWKFQFGQQIRWWGLTRQGGRKGDARSRDHL